MVVKTSHHGGTERRGFEKANPLFRKNFLRMNESPISFLCEGDSCRGAAQNNGEQP